METLKHYIITIIYSNITSSQLYIVTLHHHSYIYFSEHLNAGPVVVPLVAEVLHVYHASDLMYFASFLIIQEREKNTYYYEL